MPSSQVFHGLQIRFGTTGLGASAAFGAYAIFANADEDKKITKVLVKDQKGTTISYAGVDPIDSATFVIIPATNTTNDGNAPMTYVYQGVMFTITDSNAGSNDLIGTNWIVDSITQNQIQDGVARITVKADRYFQITS